MKEIAYPYFFSLYSIVFQISYVFLCHGRTILTDISNTRIKIHLDLGLIFENNLLWKELHLFFLLPELYFDNFIIMQQLNKNDILTDYHQLRYSCMYSKL